MRSAKVPTPVAAAAIVDSEPLDQSRMPRHRKAPRSPSQSLSSVSSSANSSDAEGPAPPGRGAKREAFQPRHAVVIDHQGAGKVMHKPDGTVVWEPAPECDGGASRRGGQQQSLLELLAFSGFMVTCASGIIGLNTAQNQTIAAARAGQPYCLTTKQLAGVVAHTVTGYLAGTATGMVLGPLLAVRTVAGVLVRPALVGLLLHQGIKRIARWRCGVAGLLRKLHSSDPSKVLEALRAIIAMARRNPRFAREFNKLKGMEALLQRLAAAFPDCPMLHLIAQALAELCKDQECRDSLVAAGGVPRLVELLKHPNPVVSGLGLEALARLSDHALAVEAIREAGGLDRLVEMSSAAVAAVAAAPGLAAVPSSQSSGSFDRKATLLPAVKLLQALSLDPASKAAIGAAGGVGVLLEVVARCEPRSEAQSEAIAALHNCLRGCPDNQRTLAALPAASEVLRAALGGFGPCWHTAKGDLHALLNVLARLQGVQEAGGFVVVQSQVAAAAARDAAAAVGSAAATSAGATAAAKA